MKKLNKIIYNKLILQAEEAKDKGMTKLASNIFNSIGPIPEDDSELIEYNQAQLEKDIELDLWKIATNFLKYHDLKSVDAEKLNESIQILAEEFNKELKSCLKIKDKAIGPFEKKLPGE